MNITHYNIADISALRVAVLAAIASIPAENPLRQLADDLYDQRHQWLLNTIENTMTIANFSANVAHADALGQQTTSNVAKVLTGFLQLAVLEYLAENLGTSTAPPAAT